MGKIKGIPPFYGTKGPYTIYDLNGQTCIRSKSSLNGKRVKTAPEFEKTRAHASLMAKASKIASEVYKGLGKKSFPQYRILTGQALRMLKEGMEEPEVLHNLRLLA
jgi:hypothetical protein